MSRLGLNVADIQDVVVAAIGGQEVGTIQEGDRRFPFVIRLHEQLQQDINA